MLSMYIFYILNPLLIEIKNIFQHYNLCCLSYNTRDEKCIFLNSPRQTSQLIIMEDNVIKNSFTENNFLWNIPSVHTNSFKFKIK